MNHNLPGLCPPYSEAGNPVPRAVPGSAEDVVEFPLLLPGWEVAALEEVARERGQTTAQVIRQLIRGYLAPQG